MKVLFVSSGNAEHGISPFIKSQGDSLIKEGLNLSYYIIKGKGLKGYLKNIEPLRAKIMGSNFDIIHAHYGLSALIAYFAKTNQKIVVSFMGDDILGSHNKDGSRVLKSLLGAVVNRIIANTFYDYIIVKSKEMLKGLKSSKTSVIPNGVDITFFSPQDKMSCSNELQINLEKKTIMFVSDPKRAEKNFELANKATKIINNDRIDLKVVNRVAHNQLVKYYNAADVILLTSFHEGSPNVIKEAMACNTPIVSTDVGDVKGLIEQTKGCYITSFEPNDVAKKIQKALEFGARTNGRQRIVKLGLDSVTVAKNIIRIYLKVLEK